MCSPVLGAGYGAELSAELDYSVGGPGWRAARLAYTIAKRSKPAARAEREGSLRCLCARSVSWPLIWEDALEGSVDVQASSTILGIWWRTLCF